MHFVSAPITPSPVAATATPEKITPYHWLVVIIASLGWLFDCMDQRLFILARESALAELLGSLVHHRLDFANFLQCRNHRKH